MATAAEDAAAAGQDLKEPEDAANTMHLQADEDTSGVVELEDGTEVSAEAEGDELAAEAAAEGLQELEDADEDDPGDTEQPDASDDDQDEPEAEGDEDDEPEADTATDLDASLKQAGYRAGLSDEDIAALPNAEAVLGKLKAGWDSISAEHGKAGGEKPDDEADDSTQPQEDQFDLDWDAEVEDSDGDTTTVSELFDGPTREKVLQPMIDRIRAQDNAVAEMQTTMLVQLSDVFFQGVQADHGKVYGTGSLLTMDQSSPEFKARSDLLMAASQRRQGALAAGQDMTALEAMQKALVEHQGDNIKATARRELNRKVKKRGKQVVSRATQRTPQPVTEGSDEAAAAEFKKQAAAMGL